MPREAESTTGRQIALLDQIFHVDLQTLDIGHQGIIGGFGHVDQAAVEVVPAAHNAEQGYGGQNRLGNGDEDLGQNLERLAPSMKAASSSSLGTAAKKFITRMTLKMGTAPGKTRAQTVLSRP